MLLLVVALPPPSRIHVTATSTITTIIAGQNTPTMLWLSKETTTTFISVDDPLCPTLVTATTNTTVMVMGIAREKAVERR